MEALKVRAGTSIARLQVIHLQRREPSKAMIAPTMYEMSLAIIDHTDET
jgi:hypothetical protein